MKIMNRDVQSILFSEDEIKQRVAQMGEQISRDYQGKELVLLGILRGCVVFLSDLMRHITVPCEIDFMSVSSYGFGTQTTGAVTIRRDMTMDPKGKNLLIVEDILDTGVTLSHVKPALEQRGAESVKIASLLDKPSRRKVDIQLDYYGFSTPNQFLVGYGLDYAEKYRNLPYIGILKPEIYQK